MRLYVRGPEPARCRFLQILANLVMEKLLGELRELICPRLRGKLYDRQRSWTLVRKPRRVFVTCPGVKLGVCVCVCGFLSVS